MSTKTTQGQLWSSAPEYWARHFEPYFMPMYREVLKELHLTDETILLDAGCGSGLFSNLAIRQNAQVIGMDAAPGLLELARQRNPGNNFLEEDLEALPFSGNSFHVVTAFNSFQYAGTFEGALQESKRVLRKFGRVVIGIWDEPQYSDATTILKAISTLLPPPPAGAPGPFALSEPGKLEEILNKADFKLLKKIRVACPMLFHSLEDAVKSFLGTGPAAAALKQNDERTLVGVIRDAFKPYHLTEDLYFLQNHFLVFIAEK